MRARIRNTEIFFDVDGAALVADGPAICERPTAFLVHGGPGGDHTVYKWKWPSLTSRLQVVYFDHRGQGRSARGDPRTYTLDENVEDMEALREHLGLGPIVSIGASYGGLVAMAHAARYPDAVSRLIVVSTISHRGYATRARQLVAERGTPEQVAACEDLFAGRIDTPEKLARYQELMGPLYSRKYDAAVAKRGLKQTILSSDALNQAHGPSGFMRSLDLRGELGAIKAPTLIISGRHDWICPPEFSEEIQRLIPRSHLLIFEESAHSVAGDEPQKLLDAIAGFLIQTTRGARP